MQGDLFMKMKTGGVFLLVLLVSVTGGCLKKKQEPKKTVKKVETFSEIDIPLAGEQNAIYDNEVGQFVGPEDITYQLNTSDNISWVEDTERAQAELEKIYFEFDKYNISKDQQKAIAHNAGVLKNLLAEKAAAGETNPIIVLDGYTDTFGDNDYNRTLSTKRAQVVRDEYVAQGIPAENLKIVGRGKDMLVVLSGDKDEQAPNRRTETTLIYS